LSFSELIRHIKEIIIDYSLPFRNFLFMGGAPINCPSLCGTQEGELPTSTRLIVVDPLLEPPWGSQPPCNLRLTSWQFAHYVFPWSRFS